MSPDVAKYIGLAEDIFQIYRVAANAILNQARIPREDSNALMALIIHKIIVGSICKNYPVETRAERARELLVELDKSLAKSLKGG